MIWYFGNVWTAEETAEGQRTVTCVGCGFHFGYAVTITGVGEARSPYFLDETGAQQRAQERAEEDLATKFETYVVPMPCPNCGDYQPDMIAALKRRSCSLPIPFRRWMVWVYCVLTALALAVLLGLVFVPNANDTPIIYGGVAIPLWGLATLLAGMFGIVAVCRRCHDPYKGTTAKQRILEARDLCWSNEPPPAPLPVANRVSPITLD